jgi:hypothetical protein
MDVAVLWEKYIKMDATVDWELCAWSGYICRFKQRQGLLKELAGECAAVDTTPETSAVKVFRGSGYP